MRAPIFSLFNVTFCLVLYDKHFILCWDDTHS